MKIYVLICSSRIDGILGTSSAYLFKKDAEKRRDELNSANNCIDDDYAIFYEIEEIELHL